MIQRLQSVFLLIASAVWAIGILTFDFSALFDDTFYLAFLIIILIVSVLSLVSLLLFKNRKTQLKLNTFNIILNVLIIGLLVYALVNLPGGFDLQKGIGLIFPVGVVLALLFANQFIRKDEKLVKSIDRIR